MYVQLQLSAQNVAELQQQHWDLRAEGSSSSSSSERQTGLPTTVRTSHPDSAWTNSTGSTTSPASQTSTPTPDSSDSASSTQFSAQSPRTSSNSTAPMPHSSTTATAVNCHHHSSPHQPCPPNSTHTSSSSISTPHFSSGCPHPSCPLQAATPVCSSSPAGSIPGPQSPAPASTFQEVSLTYSTVCLCIISIYKCTCMYKIHKMEIIFFLLVLQSGVHASSTAELCKQPGAVIESFVSHSPGIFSGTFSGKCVGRRDLKTSEQHN